MRRGGRSRGRQDHKDNAVGDPGIGSSRKQGGPGILSNPLFGGNKLCSSERAGSIPMKMLIDDEVSGEVSVRHTSPGIVGKLMGLDTMPSFHLHSHSAYSGSHLQCISPGSFGDKYGFSGDVPHRRSTDEIPEFKDVFEVMEATRMKNQSQKAGRSNICSALDKVDSADMNFVKFMGAKHLSTDESFQRSKEFDDALEALVSNKDLLLEFLRESNHASTMDLPDLSCSSLSAVNHITVLKPSRRSKFIDADFGYPPEQDTERCYRAPKESKYSPRKPCVSLSSQPPKEDTGPLRRKVSRSSCQERIDTCVSPTRIVVLKPCLKKTENMEGAFPLTHEMFRSSYRKPKAPLDGGNGTRSTRAEEYMYQMSTGESDMLGCSGKGSMEIAAIHEITKQIMRAGKGGTCGKQVPNPDIGAFVCDEQASLLSSIAKLKSSEAYQRSSDHHDAWDGPNSGSKTSIRKEAKRRLSDRWRMTRQYQHP